MCSCQSRRKSRSKVSGMAKKNKNQEPGIIGQIVNNDLPITGGFIAGNMVANLPFAQTNPILSAVLPIAGGIVTPMVLKSDLGKNLGAGMVVAGVVNGVKTLLPSVAPIAGLAGVPYRSTLLPGVAGHSPHVYVE